MLFISEVKLSLICWRGFGECWPEAGTGKRRLRNHIAEGVWLGKVLRTHESCQMETRNHISWRLVGLRSQVWEALEQPIQHDFWHDSILLIFLPFISFHTLVCYISTITMTKPQFTTTNQSTDYLLLILPPIFFSFRPLPEPVPLPLNHSISDCLSLLSVFFRKFMCWHENEGKNSLNSNA